MMTIRYQNGERKQAITLSRTESKMRVAIPDTEDALELRKLSGTWVTDDCEPVTIEYPSRRAASVTVTEEDCICSADLAAHLIRLLHTDSSEDLMETPEPSPVRKLAAAIRIA
jgi:hypothetical protein